MNLMCTIVVHTANVLGIFSDPFEFEGDYGTTMNVTREKVFEKVVAKEAMARHLANHELLLDSREANGQEITALKAHRMAQAIVEDQLHGPTLFELVSRELIEAIHQKQQEMQSIGFSVKDLAHFLDFMERHGTHKIFRWFRHLPPFLLRIDKTLRCQAAREGKQLDLPLLSSMEPLKGRDAYELKRALLDAILTERNLHYTIPQKNLIAALQKVDEQKLREMLGHQASLKDLEGFCSPAGQLFFLWLYHALDLHLIAEEPEFIEQVNFAKKAFACTMGDPFIRAHVLRNKLLESNTQILFTQESDAGLATVLQESLFLPVDTQNPADGCFVFLRRDCWEPTYEVIPLSAYAAYHTGKVNLILATHKRSKEKFLLAACHGQSTNSDDARLQVQLIVDQFHLLSKKTENQGLQLIIGIDANTKSPEEVQRLRQDLDILGLQATNCGPTTIKRRMVTAQHSKAGKFVIDEEDFLIILKPESGGHYRLTNPTLGFKKGKTELKPLPNLEHLSDHYPVGATLEPMSL